MTASDLKFHVEQSGTNPHFFTRSSMKFFGDTMRNYGVRSTVVHDREGRARQVWELYRRRPVKCRNQASTYFDKETFQTVHPCPVKKEVAA